MNCCRSNLCHKELDSGNKSLESFLEGLIAGCSCQGMPFVTARVQPAWESGSTTSFCFQLLFC